MSTIIIGSDHAGYDYKQHIIKHYAMLSFEDVGTHSNASCDYADFAHICAQKVMQQQSKGILICGSANGVCITANKHQGIRAALAWTPEIAALARAHNDANIICIPARFVTINNAYEILDAFFKTPFEGGRHLNRINKIDL